MARTPDLRSHATHDLELIAAHAAGDASGSDLATAMALVAGCPACAALHHDLRAIAAALPELPAPVRPRSFTLTPEQAATLRPSGWRRFAGILAGPRFRFAAPFGTGLATLGLAGLLLGVIAGAPLGAGTATSGLAAAPAAAPAGTLSAAAASPGTNEMSTAAPAAVQPSAVTGRQGEGPSSTSDTAPQPSLAPPPNSPLANDGAASPAVRQPVATAPAASPRGSGGTAALGPVASPGTSGGVPAADTDSKSALPPSAADAAGGPVPVDLLPAAGSLALLSGVALVALRWVSRRLAARGIT